MPYKDAGIHAGHRQRLKDRFLKEGLDHFEPHNALELLLFFGIPRRDTNAIAHQLLDNFGSFSAVLDAPYEELVKVKGMTAQAAILIKLSPAIGRMYDIHKSEPKVCLNTTQAVVEYIKPYFKGKTTEEIYVLYLDNACHVISCKRLAVGEINSVPISIRRIIETAIASNATNIILAHNHPFGLSTPSYADLSTTIDIGKALKNCEVNLLDHVIVSPKDAISMADMGYYSYKKL